MKVLKYSTLAIAAVFLLAIVLLWNSIPIFINLFLFGTPLIIIGMVAYSFRDFNNGLSEKKVEDLKTQGQKIMTTFKALDRRWNYSVNGQSPVVVYSQDDKGQTYQSENLWFSGADVESYDDPKFKAWQTLQAADLNKKYLIPVYVDSKNPHKYYMDLGDLTVSS